MLAGTGFGRDHDLKGGVAGAERRRAAGRRNGPEAVTEQKAGYITADTDRTKVFIRAPAREVRRSRSRSRMA